ncbi:metallophosphoesterase, partial [bacterium]|nr:metallophosphoesterase [candidate division CSSED10-310 bacterium]
MKKISFVFIVMGMLFSAGHTQTESSDQKSITGHVYLDLNKNRAYDRSEPGVSNVFVSNGKEVVKTDSYGRYSLPAYDEMVVFISKPSGFTPPLNRNNVPQFCYIHQPQGSPQQIKQYPGIKPTGPLPKKIDFALYFERSSMKKHSCVIAGDNQVYSDKEIEYLRNSLIKEAAAAKASFFIGMGDNIGDVLSLYPRYLSVLAEMGMPVWLVPGNHDMNLDAPTPAYSLETFKREFGPSYYSFNYGDVHYIVLNSVVYPSPQSAARTYHGEIDNTQMQWLANDLKYVDDDKLIVLNMHIPLVSDIDRKTTQHQVLNRQQVYDLLQG